ncbi:LysR family transcriptional regulator [Psychrosphaera sp. 1_MG-2023]|uniref:LysR family transcriptional regulator n=1 Tax=Psychrosphaera sp. 1_MG-2023 TaxID=3062643 RepID=UPI0026E32C29|nr:LysR family transcriptional regulator [Psychrosphaera sp. 1_MG-2023]MDO6720301.1 LysR family transcriptional regulator [Psychrosphaera sp. 1_MG-2023]
MINQTWLNTFCTLVEVGHFTKTAENLFMTQSGVSQHIKKLENQLGVALLIRHGKSFSLTNAGEQLHKRGRELLNSFQELEGVIKFDEQYEGKVKISSPGSIGLKLYPHLLNIQQVHPKLVMDYTFAPNKNIEQNLLERKIDLGLLTELSDSRRLVSKKIANEPLVLVTASDVKSIDWGVLIELGFISHPDAAHHGRLLLSKNFEQFETIEQFQIKGFSNQISLILEPVSKGFGFTILPLYAAKAFYQQDKIYIHQLAKPVAESLFLCTNRHSIMANRIKFISQVVTTYLESSD